MPCYSTIRTKMNNADNLGAALAALGCIVYKEGVCLRATKGTDTIIFRRYDKQSAFNVSGDTDYLSAIGRKYAEVGVRAWAKRSQFNVLDNDGVQMTLVTEDNLMCDSCEWEDMVEAIGDLIEPTRITSGRKIHSSASRKTWSVGGT